MNWSIGTTDSEIGNGVRYLFPIDRSGCRLWRDGPRSSSSTMRTALGSYESVNAETRQSVCTPTGCRLPLRRPPRPAAVMHHREVLRSISAPVKSRRSFAEILPAYPLLLGGVAVWFCFNLVLWSALDPLRGTGRGYFQTRSRTRRRSAQRPETRRCRAGEGSASVAKEIKPIVEALKEQPSCRIRSNSTSYGLPRISFQTVLRRWKGTWHMRRHFSKTHVRGGASIGNRRFLAANISGDSLSDQMGKPKRFHADRGAGGDCHHRGPGRVAVARRAGVREARGGRSAKTTCANGGCLSQLCRCGAAASPRVRGRAKLNPAAFSRHSRTKRRREHPYLQGVHPAVPGAKRDLQADQLSRALSCAGRSDSIGLPNYTANNQAAVAQAISTFLCPSAPHTANPYSGTWTDMAIPVAFRVGANDYGPSNGIARIPGGLLDYAPVQAGSPIEGAMSNNLPSTKFRDNTDGTSQTALMWEIAARPDLYQRGKKVGTTTGGGWTDIHNAENWFQGSKPRRNRPGPLRRQLHECRRDRRLQLPSGRRARPPGRRIDAVSERERRRGNLVALVTMQGGTYVAPFTE